MFTIYVPPVEVEENDNEFSTTFRQDFTIAEHFGNDAVRDTFNVAFEAWKDDYRYLTDLVIVLNHKIWEHYKKNENLARIYNDMWMKAAAYAEENLKGDELSYYFALTD